MYIIKILPVPTYAGQAVFGVVVFGPKNCQLAQMGRLDCVIPSNRLYHGPKQNGSKVNHNRQKFFCAPKITAIKFCSARVSVKFLEIPFVRASVNFSLQQE